MKEYSIPRKEAASIAWISLRTLDRYVLAKKIDYKKIKWRVLFCKNDLEKIKIEKNIETIDNVDTKFDFKKDKAEHQTIEKQEVDNQIQPKNISNIVEIIQLKTERDSYKKMFEITNENLKEKQLQLEKLNFKLWEILAKQNIPLLEKKQKNEEIAILKKQLKESKRISEELSNEISFQKLVKTIFLFMLLATISILSFWYVYNFKV